MNGSAFQRGGGNPPPPVKVTPDRSRMLDKYLAYLSRITNPVLVDRGPICGGNIDLFLRYASKLHVCDMIRMLGKSASEGLSAAHIAGYVDFPENSIDGIHLWDLPDHLDTKNLEEVIKRCSNVLKPGGMLLMLASTAPSAQPNQLYLSVNENLGVQLRKVTSAKLSYYHRPNRDIDLILRPLEQYCSFVSMNGIREFLFRKKVQEESAPNLEAEESGSPQASESDVPVQD